MSKDIYLAGKVGRGEVSLGEFAAELEARGHRVIEKWWEKGLLPKPYLDHMETSRPAAALMINAAWDSDVCILFPTDDILGAMGELGAAIGSTHMHPNKQIIVVNPFEVRQSVFYAHPEVIAVHGLDQVRSMEWF